MSVSQYESVCVSVCVSRRVCVHVCARVHVPELYRLNELFAEAFEFCAQRLVSVLYGHLIRFRGFGFRNLKPGTQAHRLYGAMFPWIRQ